MSHATQLCHALLMLTVREGDGLVTFSLRVSPKAKKNAFGRVHNGCLKVSVTAAQESGAANRAVCKLLAKKLGVAQSSVEILQGHAGREKLVQVSGTDSTAVTALAKT